MGRILNPQIELSPLSGENALADVSLSESTLEEALLATQDFWEQYFRFQDLAEVTAEQNSRVNVDITNQFTGESFHFKNIVLKASSASD